MQLGIPLVFTSLVLQTKLVSRSAESRLPLAIRARMAPPIASATVLLVPQIDIAFSRYRNLTRVDGRWIYVLGNGTIRSEIFVCCQDHVCFHNFPFHA